MEGNNKKLRVSFNSPVIIGFTFVCLIALLLSVATRGYTNRLLFSVYRSSFANLFTYIRFIGHVFGHASWSHFLGNIMMILVVGPLLEEKYGSANMLAVIVITALVTGLINFMFFPYTRLLGASGVVFALIILSSITSIEDGAIPLTFILVTAIYIGQQVYEGMFVHNNVANLTHIVGGLVGAGLGYVMNKNKKY